MLPLDQQWYRRLLGFAVPLGLAAGVLALLYTWATGAGIGLFFDSEGTGWMSGKWWWIPLVAAGGLFAALLRRAWDVPEHVPGAIAFVKAGWVDPGSAPRLLLVSVVSLVFGASLGPSFGLVLMGGALGAWIVTRWNMKGDQAKHDYSLAGMAGGLGSAFSAPLFASVLTSELSTIRKRQYVAAFVPQLIAATLGFVVFWGVTGRIILGAFEVPSYDFAFVDLFLAVVLGVLSAVVLLIFVIVDKAVTVVTALITNPLVRGVAGGALVGLIAFALPLTLNAGSSQLVTVLDDTSMLGIGFLAAVLLGKMLAVSVSLSSGFIGGNVFPLIFIGGAAGVLVHLVIPEIPLSLCVAAMMAGVPGAFLDAPLSLTLIAVGTVGLGGLSIAPVAVTVVTAYLGFSAVRLLIARRRPVPAPAPATGG